MFLGQIRKLVDERAHFQGYHGGICRPQNFSDAGNGVESFIVVVEARHAHLLVKQLRNDIQALSSQLFRCVLASLYEVMSVRRMDGPSDGPSVRNPFFLNAENEQFSS